MNSDLAIRLGLAILAGLNFLYGIVPDDAGLAYLIIMPLKSWIGFIVSIATAYFSPSLTKAVANKIKGNSNA